MQTGTRHGLLTDKRLGHRLINFEKEKHIANPEFSVGKRIEQQVTGEDTEVPAAHTDAHVTSPVSDQGMQFQVHYPPPHIHR